MTYRVNPITAALARRLIKVPYVAMVNLLAGRALVPELLQAECAPKPLAAALVTLLSDPTAAAAQRAGFAAVMDSLRVAGGEPSDAAARAILDCLDKP